MFEKRVARYEKVPKLLIPNDFESWIKKQKLSDNKITVFKLRDMWILNCSLENKIKDLVLNNKSQIERKNEYLQKIRMIKNVNASTNLFGFLDNTEYLDLHIDIIDKIIELDDNSYSLFIDKLSMKYSDMFFDNALRYFARLIEIDNMSDVVLELIKMDYIRDPKDFASLLQVFGKSKKMEDINLLYSYYVYFKDNFLDDYHFEGPLFGMFYMLDFNKGITKK
jgi:hypothetical protein